MLVYANYNNKEFRVFIDSTNDTIDGVDDYQYEEILNDIKRMINNDFGTPTNSNIIFGELSDYIVKNNYGFVKEYYTGNNLKNVIDNNDVFLKALVEYINIDNLNNKKYILESDNYKLFLKLYIVNYKSERDYNNSKDHEYNINGSYFESRFYDNSDKLKDVLTYLAGDIKYYNFK